MYSEEFCGSKAADYLGLISSSINIVLSGIDIIETLEANDQLFRRILSKLSSRDESNKVSINFLIRSKDSSLLSAKLNQEIENFINSIIVDISDEVIYYFF